MDGDAECNSDGLSSPGSVAMIEDYQQLLIGQVSYTEVMPHTHTHMVLKDSNDDSVFHTHAHCCSLGRQTMHESCHI